MGTQQFTVVPNKMQVLAHKLSSGGYEGQLELLDNRFLPTVTKCMKRTPLASGGTDQRDITWD